MGAGVSEHHIQCKLINELSWRLRPEVVRFAIPNGGLRNGRVAVQMKAEGLLPGMPDLGFAMEEGRTAWLELKNDKGRLSDLQIGVRRRLENLGHRWRVARSVEEAIDQLNELGVLK
jgi:hypothetical protein